MSRRTVHLVIVSDRVPDHPDDTAAVRKKRCLFPLFPRKLFINKVILQLFASAAPKRRDAVARIPGTERDPRGKLVSVHIGRVRLLIGKITCIRLRAYDIVSAGRFIPDCRVEPLNKNL